jgi:hypothetical protein
MQCCEPSPGPPPMLWCSSYTCETGELYSMADQIRCIDACNDAQVGIRYLGLGFVKMKFVHLVAFENQ